MDSNIQSPVADNSYDPELHAEQIKLAAAAIGAAAYMVGHGYPDDLTDADLRKMKPALLELGQSVHEFFLFLNGRNR